jgi:hypothetical protein
MQPGLASRVSGIILLIKAVEFAFSDRPGKKATFIGR